MIRWKWDAEVEQWVHYNTHLACTCVGWLGRTSLLSNAKRIFVSKVEFHRWLPTIEPIFLLCNVGEDRIFSFKSSCRISRLLQSELLAFQTPHNGAINWTNRMNKIHAANTKWMLYCLCSGLGRPARAHARIQSAFFSLCLSRHFSLGLHFQLVIFRCWNGGPVIAAEIGLNRYTRTRKRNFVCLQQYNRLFNTHADHLNSDRYILCGVRGQTLSDGVTVKSSSIIILTISTSMRMP